VLRSYAAEMDKIKDPVQGATKETQNTPSLGTGLESQHSCLSATNVQSKAAQITTTKRCPSVQNNGASSEVVTAVDPSKNNQQQEIKHSQSQRQNGTQVPAGEAESNPKKTRQRLRKGKWTIEEEEYTSRIIQYFSTGFLTLPDGATLRSYLAEKLNCDPMRITKKFTGACCLGRRAYHLRDRPRASSAEVEMASFELLHLEQRFRLRVEHEQTGLPLPPRHELLASQPTPTAAVVSSLFTLQQGAPAFKAANHWIQNPVIAPNPAHAALLPGLAGIIPNANVPGSNANLNLQNSSTLLLAAGQLLLQNPSERTQASNSSSAAATAPLQMLNNLVASYALSRALTQHQAGISVLQPPGSSASPVSSTAPKITNSSSAPPTSTFNFIDPDITTNATKKSPQRLVVRSQENFPQNVQSYQQQQHEKTNPSTSTPQISKKEEHTKKLKAAFEEQQRALRMAYEKSLQDAHEREEKSFAAEIQHAVSDSKGTKPTADANTASSNSKPSIDTVSPAEQLQRSYEAHLASLQKAEQQASLKTSSKFPSPQTELTSVAEVEANRTDNTKTKRGGKSSQNKTQDEEAGAILLGFLNSLRESFEDAVEAKDGNGNKETNKRNINITRSRKVTAGGPKKQSITNVQLESSTVMTEVSSDSSSHINDRRNVNDNNHPHVSIKSRRQASDPITSLSHFQSSKRKVKPASVTETSSSTSSQPTIEQPSSSDSKSDKMGHSSSEESEKEITASRRISKGPPRKRLKGFHEPHEFTRENLMAHSKRMDMECGQSGDASNSDE